MMHDVVQGIVDGVEEDAAEAEAHDSGCNHCCCSPCSLCGCCDHGHDDGHDHHHHDDPDPEEEEDPITPDDDNTTPVDPLPDWF